MQEAMDMASDAMWYKDGIFYNVKTTHVNFFLKHPDLLGFSQKEKEALCVKNGLTADSTFCPEPSVQRDNLVLAVLERGAVRIRFYGGQTSVQCYDHNNSLSFAQLRNCIASGMGKCFGNFLTVKDTLGWGMDLNNIGWGVQIRDFLK
jgi:hypothetical protein